MPASQADVLTEAHRQAQTQISITTAIAMLRLWPLLNPSDEASTSQWLSLVMRVIRTQRAESARLAAGWLTAYRAAELPREPILHVVPQVDLNEEQVISSMMAMGPQALRAELDKQVAREAIRAKAAGREPEKINTVPGARNATLAKLQAGAAIRHVRNGGRDTSSLVIATDPLVRGYFRVSDGSPCWWCAMLLSRGPVYQEDSFDASDLRFYGPGNAKVHDNCGCDLKPLYRRAPEDEMDEWKRYERQWIAAGKDKDGNVLRGHDVVKRFRAIHGGSE